MSRRTSIKWILSAMFLLFTLDVARVIAGTWELTGDLTYERKLHSAMLLSSGEVIVAGGFGATSLSSCEIYNPFIGSWASTDNLNKDRYSFSSLFLPTSKVLVGGGYSLGSGTLSSCELYEPWEQSWQYGNSLDEGRYKATTTLLQSGNVLLAGGGSTTAGPLSSCEIYDPVTGEWSPAYSLNTERCEHTATLLPSAKVLVAGGSDAAGATNLCEIYDPLAQDWFYTGTLIVSRFSHTATLLPNGKILVMGGYGNPVSEASCEIYDTLTEEWTMTDALNIGRRYHTATLLPNGKVLVAGGIVRREGSYWVNTASSEIFDPLDETWTLIDSMSVARGAHTANILACGKVLIVGGGTRTCELYTPSPGYEPEWRPVIENSPDEVMAGSEMTVTGVQFRGIAEASGGLWMHSQGNYPIVTIENVETVEEYILPHAIENFWSDSIVKVQMAPSIPPGEYLLRVVVNGIPSEAETLKVIEVGITEVVKPDNLISYYKLYPNPFKDILTIQYRVRYFSYLSIDIYDLSGRLVRSLQPITRDSSSDQVVWDCCNTECKQISPGIYFIRINVDGKIIRERIVKVK